VFSIGLLGGLQTSGGQQVKQQVIMEAYNWGTTNSLVLTLRNVGPASIELQDYFVNGIIATALSGTCGYSGGISTLTVGSSCTETITPPTTAAVGVAYVVKVVSVDGAVFSYSAIAGSAS